MSMIFITNRNAETHVDRYDGVEYVFPPNERVAISQEAATHMFGIGLADKTDTLVRLGKASRYDAGSRSFVEDERGVRWLANFIPTRAVMVSEDQQLPVVPQIGGAQELEIA